MASIMATLRHPSTPTSKLVPGSSGIRGGWKWKSVLAQSFILLFSPRLLIHLQTFFCLLHSAFNLFAFLFVCLFFCFLLPRENCLYNNLTNVSQQGLLCQCHVVAPPSRCSNLSNTRRCKLVQNKCLDISTTRRRKHGSSSSKSEFNHFFSNFLVYTEWDEMSSRLWRNKCVQGGCRCAIVQRSVSQQEI